MKTFAIIFFLLLLKAIQADAQINVPLRKNITITPDGTQGQQEWSNALKISLERDYGLYLQADKDWLYIGAFGRQTMPYTDMYIKTTTGLINLHASMQLGERLLPQDNSWNDETPAWNWGNNTHWTANTVTYKTGASENQPFREQVNAYEGQEFKIAISKTGKEFSLLVVMRDFVDADIHVSFPANGNQYDVRSWQTLSIRN
ncbi:MAG: hypothetical protein KIT62_07435 [Cyclobacteriaceae bacterium]|nr:hypothetical protein [Cyclobacteriaceae bacterium]